MPGPSPERWYGARERNEFLAALQDRCEQEYEERTGESWPLLMAERVQRRYAALPDEAPAFNARTRWFCELLRMIRQAEVPPISPPGKEWDARVDWVRENILPMLERDRDMLDAWNTMLPALSGDWARIIEVLDEFRCAGQFGSWRPSGDPEGGPDPRTYAVVALLGGLLPKTVPANGQSVGKCLKDHANAAQKQLARSIRG